ncbi:MAG TPA: ATP-dependent metalloprotease, partial [Xanthomonadaceae bacterium]|nr:ATP-dependent metalloprotease [Xanthomonadaceae bacterium]
MNDLARNLLLWLVVAVVLAMVFQSITGTTQAAANVAYSDFIEEVRSGNVTSVHIEADGVTARVTRTDGSVFTTFNPNDRDLVNDLIERNIKFDRAPPERPSILVSMMISLLPVLLLIGVWVYFMRQMQQGGGKGAMSFG